MIVGLDGPVVLVPAKAAAILARPLERLVADARRRGETVDPSVIAALADCERVRRLLVALADGSARGTAEPVFAEPDVEPGHEQTLSTIDAADILGCSASYLRRQARQHRLGVKVGPSWRFAAGDIALLAAKAG